jgi:hypothetical protein
MKHAPQLLVALLLAAILSACASQSPINNRLVIDFDRDGQRARITSSTDLALDYRGHVMEQRLAVERDAILANRDEWSHRFAAVNADSERLLLDKDHGVLQHVERSAVVDRDQLHRFFSDTPITLSLARGAGWTELTLYPGTSSRATRPQREEVQRLLASWSRDGAAYVDAVGKLYSYLDAQPLRADAVFTVLFSGDGVHAAYEEEEALINGVVKAMDRITDRMQQSQPAAYTVDEEFDLVYNPFPAELLIHTPHAIAAVENLERRADDTVAVHRAGILDAVRSLEGQWVSPDPLALVVRADEENRDIPTPRELAAMPRKWTPMVSATDIEHAITTALTPPAAYKVRWSE